MLKRKKRQPTLETLLKREFHCSRRRIYVSDQYIDPVSDAAMREFLVYDKTDELKWKEEVQDCDNFALYFRANAKKWFERRNKNGGVGSIWVYPTKYEEAHAFNFKFKLLPYFKVTYIEPQTDQECFLNARVNLAII